MEEKDTPEETKTYGAGINKHKISGKENFFKNSKRAPKAKLAEI